MNPLQETTVSCPYCGENITVLVDGSVQEQQYIEDCEVCCQPMNIQVRISSNGEFQVEARHENDV
jgi:transcription elongation factor Elf1